MHLDRLVDVLEAVACAGRPISATELQRVTGLPRPTCYRLLRTLSEQRLLDDADDSGRYRVGERLMRIALLGVSDADVSLAAAPTLRETAVHFGEAAFLSRFRNNGVEIIHVETPADPARAYMHPGLGFRPLHACSCSKAIAAFAERSFQDAILDGPMKSYTDHTNTDRETLKAEFQEIRERGYAQCVQEIETGVSSVAAPVSVGNVGVTFSVGVIGPVRRFTADYRVKVGHRLIHCADKVAKSLALNVTD